MKSAENLKHSLQIHAQLVVVGFDCRSGCVWGVGGKIGWRMGGGGTGVCCNLIIIIPKRLWRQFKQSGISFAFSFAFPFAAQLPLWGHLMRSTGIHLQILFTDFWLWRRILMDAATNSDAIRSHYHFLLLSIFRSAPSAPRIQLIVDKPQQQLIFGVATCWTGVGGCQRKFKFLRKVFQTSSEPNPNKKAKK